jgi:hypothetical protein
MTKYQHAIDAAYQGNVSVRQAREICSLSAYRIMDTSGPRDRGYAYAVFSKSDRRREAPLLESVEDWPPSKRGFRVLFDGRKLLALIQSRAGNSLRAEGSFRADRPEGYRNVDTKKI